MAPQGHAPPVLLSLRRFSIQICLDKLLCPPSCGQFPAPLLKKKHFGLRKQCIELDDQRKINYENPFRLAFREIKVPQKFLHIEIILLVSKDVYQYVPRKQWILLRCLLKTTYVSSLKNHQMLPFKHQCLGYMRHEAKRCLFTAKRDFCFYERRAFKVLQKFGNHNMIESLQEGKYIQTAMSTDHPTCPLREGIIRAKVCLCT